MERLARVCGLEGFLQEPAGSRAIVLMAHGFRADKGKEGGGFALLARELAKARIASFRFDFRYTSPPGWGDFHRMSVLTEKEDLSRLVRLFRRRFARVGVLGASFGGMVALLCAGRGVESLALWYPVSFPRETRADYNRLGPRERGELKEAGRVTLTRRGTGEKYRLGRRFFSDLAKVSPLSAARGISCPVLIMHPRRDGLVPIGQSERLLRALGSQRKKLVLTGGNHGWKDLARVRRDPALVGKAVLATAAWFKETLR